ncbi:MAG: type II toxin-antitoxin system Phd/YefM family antitoxin [bacterium]
MEKIAPISEVRNHLPSIVNEILFTNQRYIVTKQGKPAIVMISPEELETLEILADRELIKSLVKAEEDIQKGRIYSHKEVFFDV